MDEKSGVSARLTISAFENLKSAAERRVLINGEKTTHLRLSDFSGVLPAITGKVELVYEGEQEGAGIVANDLVGKAIRAQYVQYFPDPEKERKKKDGNAYKKIIDWFGEGHEVEILHDLPQEKYEKILISIPGLAQVVNKYHPKADKDFKVFLMEFALHGLAEYSMLSKKQINLGLTFKDLLSSMFTMPGAEEDSDESFFK